MTVVAARSESAFGLTLFGLDLPAAPAGRAVSVVVAVLVVGLTAALVIAALTLSIVIPKHLYDAVKRARAST